MSIMVGTVGALSAFYHDSLDIHDPVQRDISAIRLIAKMPTIAARAYKYHIGQPFISPRKPSMRRCSSADRRAASSGSSF